MLCLTYHKIVELVVACSAVVVRLTYHKIVEPAVADIPLLGGVTRRDGVFLAVAPDMAVAVDIVAVELDIVARAGIETSY